MAGIFGKSLRIGIAIVALALPQAGWAHGPSRQKVTESIVIDAPPAKVWATIADFHDMSWLPGIVKTTGAGGNEPDTATRQLTLDNGATIDESLYKYDAGEMSYSYRIDNVDVKVLPVNNYPRPSRFFPPRAAKAPSNGAAPFIAATRIMTRRRN